MDDIPYTVLGVYNPIRWNARKVGLDILKITKSLGLIPINDPCHNHQTKAPWYSIKDCAYVRRRTVKNPKATDWHQDGDLVSGSYMDDCLVLWSSNTPTEIKYNNKIFIPNPREIILFHNLSCYHRRPINAPKVRWLFRQRVNKI